MLLQISNGDSRLCCCEHQRELVDSFDSIIEMSERNEENYDLFDENIDQCYQVCRLVTREALEEGGCISLGIHMVTN